MDEVPLSVVVQALTQRVDSVTQLDVLLLVYAAQNRVWSAPDVAVELRIGADWAQQHLETLLRRGLLLRDHAQLVCTAHPELTAAVAELARLYRTHPVSVITAIYRPDKRLEDFAAAFRFRKASGGSAPAAPASPPAPKEPGHG